MTIPDRTRSEWFVGREDKLAQFEKFLAPPTAQQILSLHTNGEGGIGKTQLIARFQQRCALHPDSFAVTEIIDFYHTESHSKVGVMRQIADHLTKTQSGFQPFQQLLQDFEEAEAEKRQGIFPKLEPTFLDDFRAFAASMQAQNIGILLFFDTYEVIQGREITRDHRKQVEATDFSTWLEQQFFLILIENPHVKVVVSGRYPLSTINTHPEVWEVQLSRFTLDEASALWKTCFGIAEDDPDGDQKLINQIGSAELIERLYALADGRPILLALFADWCKSTALVPRDLFHELEASVGNMARGVTEAHQQLFEQRLIERIAQLREPEDQAVTYMAVAHRRMNPAMLQALTHLPKEECRDVLLNRLRPLSFIKYKPDNTVLLHDEMRRLILQHWWSTQDTQKQIRRQMAARIVAYYQTLLAALDQTSTEYETYQSELLGYLLLKEPREGIRYLNEHFGMALDSGKYNYADLLLREAETYQKENPEDLSMSEAVELELRRIEYAIDVRGTSQEALNLANSLIERYSPDPQWNENILRGHLFLLKGKAELYLMKFAEAVTSFQQARQTFFNYAEDTLVHEVENWLGLTYYRQSKFQEAWDWWEQSLAGFSTLIESFPKERPSRRLLQDIRYSLANLSLLHRYIGNFDRAVRYADIALDVVRFLPHNDREIVRMRILLSETLFFAGRRIDARHHAERALQLIRQEQIEDPMWEGRLKTVFCLLLYRTNEFAYLLEYYRAEEMQGVIENLGFFRKQEAREAAQFVKDAIAILSTKPGLQKYLADAYYALGELQMVMAAQGHWQEAEASFRKSLEYSDQSQFVYQRIDTLESLATLHYFSRAEEATEAVQFPHDQLKAYVPESYPELFGKYYITLGDRAFDKGLERLRRQHNDVAAILSELKHAFQHYLTAARLIKMFNEERYYLTLRIIYNRLNVLILFIQQHKVADGMQILDRLYAEWSPESDDVQQLYRYLLLRVEPHTKFNEIFQLRGEIEQVLNRGHFSLAALLIDCLIGAYRALIFELKTDDYREQFVLLCAQESRIYRALGDKYHAIQYLQLGRKELKYITTADLREGLAAYLDVCEGTVLYRRGEYGKLLEFYLKDELEIARRRFEGQYRGSLEKAFAFLHEAEKALYSIIESMNATLQSLPDGEEKDEATQQLSRRRRNLGEAKYRVGELLMLTGEFQDDQNNQGKGALSYLKEAIETSQAAKDSYFYMNALQSYATALYFSGDDQQQRQERRECEERFEQEFADSPVKYYSLMGRLRITQGDALFSQHFEQRKDLQTRRRKYQSRDSEVRFPLRTMLKHYVEACEYMAQHSSVDFSTAVGVLQQRIQFISDLEALRGIQRGLRSIWNDQKHLRAKRDELETLIRFAQIRSMLLTYEKKN